MSLLASFHKNMKVKILSAARQRLLCSVYRRLGELESRQPIVSFTFDDFPRSAYTVGGAILKSLDVRGTYYVAMGLMNCSNELGEQFRDVDLHSAAADGHELGCHTFSHKSSRRIPLAAFQQDAERGLVAIREIAALAPTSNFAYPFGEVSLTAKHALGRRMSSCRGTCGGLNGPLVDLNLLRANRLYGDVDGLDRIRRLISENERRRAWLIFYTHDVSPSPSRYGCTPSFLEATVRLALAGGAKIVPVSEVVDTMHGPGRRLES